MPPSLSPPGDRKVIEIMPEDRREDTEEISSIITYSDDPDATWIKGKKPYYGYKAHIAVDTRRLYLGVVTPAHVADTSEFENPWGSEPCPGFFAFADKGYSSMKNRATLEEKLYRRDHAQGGTRQTAYLRPASYEQADQQCALSVEQGIGTLKRGMVSPGCAIPDSRGTWSSSSLLSPST